MAKRLVESLTGVGAIHAGEILLRTTTYNLSVWSDDQASADGQTEGVDGHIDITGIGETVVLAGPGTLTLTLADGRRLAFQITSSVGGIVGRGWLPAA